MSVEDLAALLRRVEDLIENILEVEELTEPEFDSSKPVSLRRLTAEEVTLANQFEQEAAELLDPEAYAEIAPFSANEETRFEEYWDRLRELRATLEEMRDGLRKTFLPSTGNLEEHEHIGGGPRSEIPERDGLD